MPYEQHPAKKFIFITFCSTLLLTFVISVLAAVKTRTALYTATEKQGRMLAQTVSALIINELIYEKLGLVEEGGLIDIYMRDMYQSRELDLNFVALLDNNARVISHSDFKEFGKQYRDDFTLAGIKGDEVMVRHVVDFKSNSRALEFVSPLSIEGKRWGGLLFSLSLDAVEMELKRIISQIVGLSALTLILLFILIYFLSRRFIKPIIDLSHAMEEVEVEMGEKEVPVRGSDELSRLASNFNEMVRRIRGANDEMKQAHEKLLQSEKLATLGVLSSSVAHRINNPLGGLFNCVGMLRKQGDNQEFRENYLDLIEEGLDSIKTTVSQLLSTAGKSRTRDDQAQVEQVLSHVLRFLDYRMKKQNISYSQAIDPHLVVSIAPHDLEELFLNLMLNAIQAMEDGVI